jgi:hypothetical protein
MSFVRSAQLQRGEENCNIRHTQYSPQLAGERIRRTRIQANKGIGADGNERFRSVEPGCKRAAGHAADTWLK